MADIPNDIPDYSLAIGSELYSADIICVSNTTRKPLLFHR